MKFKGYTNEIIVENEIVIKKSLFFHNIYLDKQNEYNFLEQLIKLKQDCLLNPINFYWEKEELISQYKFLKNYHSLEKINLTEKIVDMVIENIIKMHNLNINSAKIKKFEYVNFLNKFHDNTINKLEIYDYYIDEIKNYESIFNKLDLVLSHNDLVPGNILIKKDKLIFIDYDYVMLNNKFFDLASFITETLNDDEKLINYFINKCIERKIISITELDTLNKIIKYQDLLWTFWAYFMFEKQNNEEFKIIYKNKLNRLKNRKHY
ncbi:phosphotransferase family protein [Spiroplasma endosymbiont of Atherix ibis]|uniref:phosphotransferase family protein n=1 Tax=Spiroplasma endosymbiont of Atherix ibis TaxID=3066291 RepID=UPI0030D5810E